MYNDAVMHTYLVSLLMLKNVLKQTMMSTECRFKCANYIYTKMISNFNKNVIVEDQILMLMVHDVRLNAKVWTNNNRLCKQPVSLLSYNLTLMSVCGLRHAGRILNFLSGKITIVLKLDDLISPAGPIRLEASSKQL